MTKGKDQRWRCSRLSSSHHGRSVALINGHRPADRPTKFMNPILSHRTAARPRNFTANFVRLGLSLFVVAFAALIAPAVNLQWDAAPAMAGVQDGAGNWSNLGSLRSAER